MRDEKLLHRRGKPAGVTSFGDHREPVDRYVLENVRAAADPMDFDAIGTATIPQAKVESRPPVALIAAAAVDLVDLRQVARHDPHPRADAVAVALDALEPDVQPVVLAPLLIEHVPQDRGLRVRVEDHHVDVSVIVQVVEGDTLRGVLGHRAQAALRRHVDELSLPIVPQQYIVAAVAGRRVAEFDVVFGVPVADEDVLVAVVVEVDQSASPVDIVVAAGAGPGPQARSSNTPPRLCRSIGSSPW